jgi:glucuronokinase
MVYVARGVGACGKFAGSGGAIIGIYRDEAMYGELKPALEAIGCRVFRLIVA